MNLINVSILKIDLWVYSLKKNLFYSWKSQVDRYLSPVSGRMTTICLPLFSGLFATSRAAHIAAPQEIPARMPSSFASLLAIIPASSFDTVMISSIIRLFKISGINPAPIPCILWEAGLPSG